MIKNYMTIMLFVLGFCFYTNAQVTGVIIDDTSMPVPGVSVVVKGTTNGTTTDFDGNYSINASQGDILVISHISYTTKEVTVTGNVMNITLDSGVSLDEVVLVGSRNKNRVVTDSPVPIDVLSVSDISTAAPQTDLNQILNYVAPSFTSNASTVADGTDHIDPAQLRGLGPDQVLVLVNGKRRHTSSLVNVNGTPGRGSVGTDLNSIPAYAIERIEVLRDGASSQYGSDAIAGVINVVMKKNTNKLDLQLTAGGNLSDGSNDHRGGWDGTKLQLDASYGFNIAKDGFINLTGSLGWRDQTRRAGTWTGSAFNLYNAIEQRALENGTVLSGMFDRVSDNAATLGGSDVTSDLINTIHQFAPQVDYLSNATLQSIIGTSDLSTLQTLLSENVTDNELAYRGLERRDINMRVGQSKVTNAQLYANSEIPLSDNTTLYWFGGYGYRDGNAAGFYRRADQSRAQTAFYANGFLPEIGSTIQDASLAAGIRGQFGEWDYDFSNTYGQNSFDYTIKNTSNASMVVNADGSFQDEFDSGGLKYSQNSINLDISRYFDVLSGFNLAFGSEFRLEHYKINAGEEASWAQYNVDGTINSINPLGDLPTDFFGNTRPGGAQVFPGFRPENEVSEGRNNFALYLDTELDVTDKFLVSAALRYENYSDFGSTFNYKFATRYKVTDGFSLRGAISNGFRAPSLAQKYFNSVSTIFVDNGSGQLVPTEQGLFRNDSEIASLLGIPELKQEESNNYSLGFTWKIPNTTLSLTTDFYYITIDDRIVMTGAFSPNTPELQTLFDAAGATSASFFANAIDTETRGVDFVLTNNFVFDEGNLKTDFALALTKTNRIGDIHASPLLNSGSNLTAYFNESARVYLEEAVPRAKASFMNTLNIKDWSFFVRQSYFGKVTDPNTTDVNGDGMINTGWTITGTQNIEHPEYSARTITDISVGYKLSEALRLTAGANNVFDIYPDKNLPALSGGDQFVYSRAVSQFGFNGRFIFARLNYQF